MSATSRAVWAAVERAGRKIQADAPQTAAAVDELVLAAKKEVPALSAIAGKHKPEAQALLDRAKGLAKEVVSDVKAQAPGVTAALEKVGAAAKEEAQAVAPVARKLARQVLKALTSKV